MIASPSLSLPPSISLSPSLSLCPVAHDFTGQWSDVTSSGVTVDLTPPYGPSHFHLINSDSTYTGLPLVVDTESGVSDIEVGLGSRPGTSDLLEWTAASYGAGLEGLINLAGISDGQLVFASIQVYTLYIMMVYMYMCVDIVTLCRQGMALD